jgi:hypothetical protein
MKIAEALMERKAIKTKVEGLKKRIYQNAVIQEGDNSIENPLDLIAELERENDKFENLIIKINETNNSVRLSNEMTLMEAIVKKDMLNYLYLIHVNLADKATPLTDRYSQREIKFVPNVNIVEIRKKADEIAKEYRLLDMKIQECNWNNELV